VTMVADSNLGGWPLAFSGSSSLDRLDPLPQRFSLGAAPL
jgi:hypothetical protein